MDEPWPVWRAAAGGRDPVARVADWSGASAFVPSHSRHGIGSITSHKNQPTKQEIEFIAWKYGISVERAKELMDRGLVAWRIR